LSDPPRVGSLVGWLTYEYFFLFAIYFIYLLHYNNESELLNLFFIIVESNCSPNSGDSIIKIILKD